MNNDDESTVYLDQLSEPLRASIKVQHPSMIYHEFFTGRAYVFIEHVGEDAPEMRAQILAELEGESKGASGSRKIKHKRSRMRRKFRKSRRHRKLRKSRRHKKLRKSRRRRKHRRTVKRRRKRRRG